MTSENNQELMERVKRYLARARRDRFNSHNFPVHAERMADDLKLPLNVIIEVGDALALTCDVERIDKRTGIPPAYRISNIGVAPDKQFS